MTEILSPGDTRPPNGRVALVALLATLVVVALATVSYLRQLESLRKLQTGTIEANRRDSLQLIRILSNLNALGFAMRDMAESDEGYGIQAYRQEFGRMRNDLKDAMDRTKGASEQSALLNNITQFWLTADQIFRTAENGNQSLARRMVADSLQAQLDSITASVNQMLVKNNNADRKAVEAIGVIYDHNEKIAYLFLAAMLLSVAAIGLGAYRYHRRTFHRITVLSAQRRELLQRLIGVQEEVFRSVARELHDDVGQVLTAVGVMLHRGEKKGFQPGDTQEMRQTVQEALDRVRSFSQALHPSLLDDYGLDQAIERHVPAWQKQTGITVDFERTGTGDLSDGKAIHVYRILQEALSNVARHSKATVAHIRLDYSPGRLTLAVADNGHGIAGNTRTGLGLIAMRERAELLGGRIGIVRGEAGGTIVNLEVPTGR